MEEGEERETLAPGDHLFESRGMGPQKGAALFEVGTWMLRFPGVWMGRGRLALGRRCRGVAQGLPCARSAHPWERLRFGSCVVFGISVLSVT